MKKGQLVGRLSRVVVAVFVFLTAFHSDLFSQMIVESVSMGSASFSVNEGATTASYEQTPAGLNFVGTQGLGDTLGGLWNLGAPKNWSGYQLGDIGLFAGVVGPNPAIPFTFELYDSDLLVIATFTASTSGLGPEPSFLPMALTEVGSGSLERVWGAQFTWDGRDSINMTWESVAVIPEPTTGVLVALAILILALRACFRNCGAFGRLLS